MSIESMTLAAMQIAATILWTINLYFYYQWGKRKGRKEGHEAAYREVMRILKEEFAKMPKDENLWPMK